ncbi:MAG: type II secretion system protein [Hydrogenibacillus sp.]|nr:type II secretion system protein [Hydrogenibacillus sp.]
MERRTSPEKMPRRRRREAGYTLIELFIVIGLIAGALALAGSFIRHGLKTMEKLSFRAFESTLERDLFKMQQVARLWTKEVMVRFPEDAPGVGTRYEVIVGGKIIVSRNAKDWSRLLALQRAQGTSWSIGQNGRRTAAATDLNVTGRVSNEARCYGPSALTARMYEKYCK